MKMEDNSPNLAAGPRLGVGACLVGHPVRFNAVSKKRNRFLDKLGEHFSLQAFCPEVAIGLGVPRETIRLVGELGAVQAVDGATGQRDYTDSLRAQAGEALRAQPDLCDYVLVKDSPSCGYARVKRYEHARAAPVRDARSV